MPLHFSTFPIIKATATGNDFLIVDLLSPERKTLWAAECATLNRPLIARAWCDRNNGFGADGMVFLDSDPQVDFRWDFYNTDGSAAEMCGNAARAVSLLRHRQTGNVDFKFQTRAGLIETKMIGPFEVEVRMPAIASEEWGKDFDFVIAGVPHAVVKADELQDRRALEGQALKIKALERFREHGTNVTFVVGGGARVQTLTYERGVEGFTKSCGTGAIAAAHSVLRGMENQELQVDVPGGSLSVIWREGRPYLRGPAKIVGEFHAVQERMP